MKVLMIGDVYASNGRKTLKNLLPKFKIEHNIDFVVANGENVTHGKSITRKHYDELKDSGVDVISSGNHIFKLKEALTLIKEKEDLLKPMNIGRYTPGKGYVIKEINNKKICVLNLMGNTFMDKANSAYEMFDDFLDENIDYDILLLDFHAEATAEKKAFAWNYDGILTAFVGTHTHVQTADERLLPNGTAFISDLGMTGAYDSIIGANSKEVIYKEKTGLPVRFNPSDSDISQFCGAIITIDDKTNKAIDIERIFLKVDNNKYE